MEEIIIEAFVPNVTIGAIFGVVVSAAFVHNAAACGGRAAVDQSRKSWMRRTAGGTSKMRDDVRAYSSFGHALSGLP
jgi:hypothetical protein